MPNASANATPTNIVPVSLFLGIALSTLPTIIPTAMAAPPIPIVANPAPIIAPIVAISPVILFTLQH